MDDVLLATGAFISVYPLTDQSKHLRSAVHHSLKLTSHPGTDIDDGAFIFGDFHTFVWV